MVCQPLMLTRKDSSTTGLLYLHRELVVSLQPGDGEEMKVGR